MLRISIPRVAMLAIMSNLIYACTPAFAVGHGVVVNTGVTPPLGGGAFRALTVIGIDEASLDDTDILNGKVFASGTSNTLGGSVTARAGTSVATMAYSPGDQANADSGVYSPQTVQLQYLFSYSENLSGSLGASTGVYLHQGIQIYSLIGFTESASKGTKRDSIQISGGVTYDVFAQAQAASTTDHPNYAVATGVFGIGQLPGTDKSHGLIVTKGKIDDGRVGGGLNPTNGTAVNLVGPLSGDYGVTSPIYAGSSGSGGGGGADLSSYDFQSVSDSLFTSFIIPDALPNGDTSFLLKFGTFSEIVPTGTLFDFTPFAAGGVSDFTLSGINPGLAADDSGAPPFVWGATYSQDGVAEVNITALPEPSTFVLGGLGLISLLALARRQKLSTSSV